GAAALEVLGRERLFAIFLEPRGPADAEDVLPHAAPDPVLRVPQGEESGLKAKRFALLVDAVLAREVVERQLHVMQLGPEVHVIREAHRLAGSGLVVDHLYLAVADIVDAVDLAHHGRAIDLQTEALLNRKRAQSADELHSRTARQAHLHRHR